MKLKDRHHNFSFSIGLYLIHICVPVSEYLDQKINLFQQVILYIAYLYPHISLHKQLPRRTHSDTRPTNNGVSCAWRSVWWLLTNNFFFCQNATSCPRNRFFHPSFSYGVQYWPYSFMFSFTHCQAVHKAFALPYIWQHYQPPHTILSAHFSFAFYRTPFV